MPAQTLNEAQIEYQASRSSHSALDLLLRGAPPALAGLPFAATLSGLPLENAAFLSAAGAAGILSFNAASGYWKNSLILAIQDAERLAILLARDRFPFETAQEVKITDEQGLGRLLERTAEREVMEWGTVLRAREEKGRVEIVNILDSLYAETTGLVKGRTGNGVYYGGDFLQFEGRHHYHPYGEGGNYHISSRDRNVLPNRMNLLTFNMPDGLEVVAFNHNHTYLPVDAGKTRFEKAEPRDILRYLGKYG